ncbi:serine/threonine protein kinase [Stutzerimonas chloritidismutans]|uniref:ATPase domain-containing protein n=1 Tax=Stutzerimonas chloritidismutans TaxID=203192 RepID=UPI0015CB1CE6
MPSFTRPVDVKTLKRLESGIDGLDAITHGGFVAGAAYLIQGRPGSGKTIFANQIAFHHTAQGGKVIFASLLSEPHDRLFQYLSTLSFFNSAEIGAGILYVSAFDTLENDGLDEVLKLLRREIIRHKATLLVLDGLMNVRSRSDTPLNTKKFIAELQVHASFAGCTALLLTSAEIDHGSPELTMVDGVFSFKEERVGMRSHRRIGIRKYRGSAYADGEHDYEITGDGIAIYPRIEALLNHPTAALALGEQLIPTGIPGLDSVLGGGFVERSATLVIGPPGAGKTTFGLNFLAGASADEHIALFGFVESPEQLIRKSNQLGLGLDRLLDQGRLNLHWQPTTQFIPDQIALFILAQIRELRLSRVLIDTLAALTRSSLQHGRQLEFASALVNEARALGSTVMMTWELGALPGENPMAPPPELCSLFDNVILTGFTEGASTCEPSLKIIKRRNGAYERSTQSAHIGQGGYSLTSIGKSTPQDR